MKKLALLMFLAISVKGFSQMNIDCSLQKIGGLWGCSESSATDQITTFNFIDTAKGAPHGYFISINNDSIFQIRHGVWRCGNDPSLNIPLGYWKINSGCVFSYYKANTNIASSSFTIISVSYNKLTLQRIK